MRRSVAKWLQNRLRTPKGRPPSGEMGAHFTEVTGASHVVVSHGDAIEILSGNDRDGYVAAVIEPRTAVKLAWWILWRWWVRALFCGWKLRAWQWTVEVELDEQKLESTAAHMRRKWQNQRGG